MTRELHTRHTHTCTDVRARKRMKRLCEAHKRDGKIRATVRWILTKFVYRLLISYENKNLILESKMTHGSSNSNINRAKSEKKRAIHKYLCEVKWSELNHLAIKCQGLKILNLCIYLRTIPSFFVAILSFRQICKAYNAIFSSSFIPQ